MPNSKASKSTIDIHPAKRMKPKATVQSKLKYKTRSSKDSGLLLGEDNVEWETVRKLKAFNPDQIVVLTVDPKLDNLASTNSLTSKAVSAKRMFSNYRKTR